MGKGKGEGYVRVRVRVALISESSPHAPVASVAKYSPLARRVASRCRYPRCRATRSRRAVNSTSVRARTARSYEKPLPRACLAAIAKPTPTFEYWYQ